MAIGYNPTIVTEGLIYYIDPNNNRSYSGIGNTVYNLVNSGFGGTFVGSTASPLDSTNTRTFYINNSTNYINGPNNIALTNNFTVSVWFKIGVYNTGSIIGKWFWNGTSAHRCWIINTDVGGSMAIVLSSDGTFTNPTIKRYLVPVSLNEYTQITFTFASGTLLVYKNGVLATVTKNIDGTFSTVFNAPTRPIQIGYFFDFSAYYNLANVGVTQIYNRVLSPSEILQNYNATKKRYLPEEQIVTDGLILNLDPGNPRSYSGTGNTIYDLSGLGNTGTLSGGLTFSVLNGGSIVNDGSNRVLFYPSANFSTNNFTMEVWVNVKSYPGTNGVFISNRGTNDNGWLFDVTLNKKGRIFIQRDAGTSYSIETINDLGLNKWANLSVVRNGTNLSLYRDGVFQNSIALPSNYDIQSAYANDYALRYFTVNGPLDGNVSTIKYYNKALSSQEVLQNYNATKNRFINVLPPVRDNLILELDAGNLSSYPGSGTTWYDLSGNNLNGTLTNGPTYSFLDSASSIVFDGTNDFINLGTSISNSFSSLTIETIIKIGITNKKQGIVSTYKSNLGWGLEILDNTFSNKFNFFGFTSSGVGTGVQSSSSAVLNQTYHLTAVYTNATSMTLYVNGVNNGSVITSYSSIQKDATANLQIGDDPETSQSVYYQGNVYTAKIYNRALSAAEIAQNFNFYRTRYGI